MNLRRRSASLCAKQKENDSTFMAVYIFHTKVLFSKSDCDMTDVLEKSIKVVSFLNRVWVNAIFSIKTFLK